MWVIEADNVNDALWRQVNVLTEFGEETFSRAGQVVQLPGPATTIYKEPQKRVLFSPARDANPFFHLVEALWMLEGRDDVETVAFYVRNMATFSDDGISLHGAYGRRWRTWFGHDQLKRIIELLKNHPSSRRAVISMWDPRADQQTDEVGKDIPCNLTIHVQLLKSNLEMTVFCRSNDAIWGATGANAVHFSILQEYLAASLDASVGTLYQISNNLHAYRGILDELLTKRGEKEEQDQPYHAEDLYHTIGIKPDIIVEDPANFDHDLSSFFDWEFSVRIDEKTSLRNKRENVNWYNPIFPSVVLPMEAAYRVFRHSDDFERYDKMLEILSPGDPMNKTGSDWLLAARQWTNRRKQAFEQKTKG